jgi:hypothetical protein
MRKVGLAIIVYFVVFTVASPGMQSKPEAIYGTLHDIAGHLLSGAQITLVNKSTRARGGVAETNEAGEYRIEVSSGAYDLYLRYETFFEKLFTVQVTANENVKKDITIIEQPPRAKPSLPAGPRGPLPEGAIPPQR